MPVLNKAKQLLFSVWKRKNWPEISLHLIKGRSPTRAVLREEIEINSPGEHPLLAMIYEIFIRQVYTPGHVFIEPDDVVVDIALI